MRLLLSIFVILIALTVWSLTDKEVPPLLKPLAPSPDADEGELLDKDADNKATLRQTTPKDIQNNNLFVYTYDKLSQAYISEHLTEQFASFGHEHQKEVVYRHLPEADKTHVGEELGPDDIGLFCFLVHKDADRSIATPHILDRVEQTKHTGGTILLGLLHNDDAFTHTLTTEHITLGDTQISCVHFYAPYEQAREKMSLLK